MGILDRFLNKAKEAKVVTLGVSRAGKTTLIRYMETGEEVIEEPKMTLGIDIRERGIELGNWKLQAIDVGGQDLYKNTLWALGVTQSDGVIYLIDGTVRPEEDERFKESQFSFEYMLSIVNPKTPLLIIINKQDLKEDKPLSVEEAMNYYEISKLKGRSFNIIGCSAKYGDGVETGLDWIIQKIDANKG